MFYLVILLLIGGLVFGYVKHRENVPWARPVIMACTGAIIVACLGLGLFSGESADDVRQEITDREMVHVRVSAQKLASYLAEKSAGTRAVVIMPFQFVPQPDEQAALLDGLKRGFGDKIEIVATVNPVVPQDYLNANPGDAVAEDVPPISSWYNADYMDQLLDEQSGEGDLIVSLVGVPDDVAKMRFFQAAGHPALAVFDLQSNPAVQAAVESGAIVAAVRYKKNPQMSADMPPADLDAAFGMRHELITAK
ncbi:MAG: hypothetical protein GC159_09540 [Phycisphaera sp.]|nr:hypothetical protein [Phycisphaera sp.]